MYKNVSNLFPLGQNYTITNGNLLAAAIAIATTCKSTPALPLNIHAIDEEIRVLLEKEFHKVGENFYVRTFFSYDSLHEWIREFVISLPSITELNLTNREYEAGLRAKDVHDDSRAHIVFVSAFSPPIPQDEDFVDLDAYARNLCHALIRSCIDIDFSTFRD